MSDNTSDNNSTILVVEDQYAIAETISLYLKQCNIDVVHCVTGECALKMVKERSIDMVLLDIMLPGKSGLVVCRELRTFFSAPIIMLTARSTEDDIILGLESGADDYITKPFRPRELIARVKSHLRRVGLSGQPNHEHLLEYQQLALDREQRKLWNSGEQIKLTKSEYRLLEIFLSQPGRVFTRNQLIERALGQSYEGGERSLDTHIYNLRKKVEKNPHQCQFIHTEHGVGYRFEFIQI